MGIFMLLMCSAGIWLVANGEGPVNGTSGGRKSIIQLNEEAGLNLFEGDIAIHPSQTAGLLTRSQLWTTKEVPYTFARAFTTTQKKRIRGFIYNMNQALSGCVKFIPKTSAHTNFIQIIKSGGCWSYVGRIGGRQQLSLVNGCIYKYIAQHEFLHALGVIHEQSRPDRDNYVTINFANIQTGMEGNFRKESSSTFGTFDIPYSYTTIMHYEPYDFSSNGQPTITALDPSFQSLLGSARELLPSDIEGVKKMYGCPL